MHSTVGENLKELKNDKRDNILNNAKRLFLKHAYYKTTIRQIVKDTKNSTGNFYFYIQDKLSVLNIGAINFEGGYNV
jgi:AcrR family transcriptional regulator